MESDRADRDALELRPAGDSGLRLSVLGLGCWSFGGGEYWGPTDQGEIDAVVRRALELGVNYFDTAELYNEGRSEESLGRAIRGLPREQLVIGSKVLPGNLYPDRVARSCEASLRRLGLDHLDLYMIHWPVHPTSIRSFTDDEAVIRNPPTLEGAVEALLRLQEQGKIRHIGVSNFGVRWLELALRLGLRPAVNQVAYNLFSRAAEVEVIPYCREHGIGIVGYSTLMQGLLGDRFATLDDVPPWQRRTRHFDQAGSPLSRHGERGAEAETSRALAEARAAARELGLSTAEVAIRWAIRDPAVTCALIGVRSVGRLEENVDAARAPLPAAVLERLDAASQPILDRLGAHLDYYESAANDRTR